MKLTAKPRGIRNNNPLNIRKSSDKWFGMSAVQDDKDFVTFSSMLYGFRAAFVNMFTHIQRGKKILMPVSLYREIQTWAPPSENNVVAYVDSVCQQTHLQPTHILKIEDKQNLVAIVRAMAYFETGTTFPVSVVSEAYDLACNPQIK